jgi:Protein of unknown function (DUF1579)
MRLHTLFCVLPLLSPAAFAQEGEMDMGPAKEVKAFDKLLGTWTGSGTVRASADARMKWTATSHTTSVLGGHFVQEDTKIVFEGEQAPPALVFRTLYGFDKETKRWMSYAISNMGTAEAKQIHWVDGKMMSGGSKVEKDMTGKDQFIVERWSTTFNEDGYSVASYQTIGNGRPFAHVVGSFKKAKVANASFKANKIAPMIPVPKQMGALQKWSGSYHLKGWMIMMPGMPKTDITAKETVESIFGGAAIEFRLKGDPIPNMPGTYEGWGAMVWSDQDQCYKSLWIDNMGGAIMQDTHIRDGKFIGGLAVVSMGQPTVVQSITTLAADGSLGSVVEYRGSGAAAPVKSFSGTYTKK